MHKQGLIYIAKAIGINTNEIGKFNLTKSCRHDYVEEYLDLCRALNRIYIHFIDLGQV